MRLPWVSRLSYETKCDALCSARETIAALSRTVADERARYDALADKYVALAAPKPPLQAKPRDPVMDAITDRAQGSRELLGFLGAFARESRRNGMDDEELIAIVSNWNRVEKHTDEPLPD